MQIPNELKRHEIKAAAGRLFAERPYHEVTLDQVAAAAKVGKGTVYVYFASKEQLYVALIAEGFAGLVDEIKARLARLAGTTWQRLAAVVEELLSFSRRSPQVFSLMRSGQPLVASDALARERTRLSELILDLLRHGAAHGELDDPHPELTALFVPALVRAALFYGPADVPHEIVADHILRLLRRGLDPAPVSKAP